MVRYRAEHRVLPPLAWGTIAFFVRWRVWVGGGRRMCSCEVDFRAVLKGRWEGATLLGLLSEKGVSVFLISTAAALTVASSSDGLRLHS